jgi:hypothetical protein
MIKFTKKYHVSSMFLKNRNQTSQIRDSKYRILVFSGKIRATIYKHNT